MWRWQPGSAYKRKYIESGRTTAPGANDLLGFETGPWAREHMRVLKSGGGTPEFLFDIREGDVIDDSGAIENSSLTNLPLRSRHTYFTTTGDEIVFELDTSGNAALSFPAEAATGMKIAIPAGKLQAVLQSFSMTTTQGAAINVQRTLDILAQRINVGEGDENAVLGQQLKSFLSSLIDILSAIVCVGSTGPAPLSPSVVTQLTALKAQYVESDELLSDFIFLSKA